MVAQADDIHARHVIVGRADGCCIPAPEPALDAKVPEDSDMRGTFGPRPQETVDRANELLDRFAAQLQARGIRVDRPTPIDFNQPVATPDWRTRRAGASGRCGWQIYIAGSSPAASAKPSRCDYATPIGSIWGKFFRKST